MCIFVVVNEMKKLPVLIYIHGGAYSKLSSDDAQFGPDFLVEREIIFVTMSYRLGVLGFMSLGTPEYSGNMGLKDQQMALKWVYDNIHHFNGDNGKITLGGHSVGAISTNYHMINDESKKYFQQILCISDSGINTDLYVDGDHRCIMEVFANYSNNPVENDDDLIKFLDNVLVGHLVQLTKTTYSHTRPIWVPLVESEFLLSEFFKLKLV